jgi:hypothetical protein
MRVQWISGLSAAFLLLALFPAAAQNATLTDASALGALNSWLGTTGQVSNVGVQEVPAQSAAQVDFDITNFRYNAPRNNAVIGYAFGPGGGVEVYNGHAQAIFIHYTDGRWVLLRVQIPGNSFDGRGVTAQ